MAAIEGNGTLEYRAEMKVQTNGNGNGYEVPKKKAVAVTLPPGSKPLKLYGDSADEFIPKIQGSSLTWINFTVKDVEKDGTLVATAFGFSESMVPTLLKGYFTNFEDRDVELGILLPAVRVKKVDFQCFPLLILVKKNLVLTIHSEDVSRLVNFSRYAEAFVRKLPENMLPEDKVTTMLCRIIDENNNRNFEQLREIEDQADWLSESLLDMKAERSMLGKSIYEMKHTLIVYLNTLWRTLDVLNNLRYGDADVITDNPKVLAKVNLLVVDVTQQISLSEHMSEVLASGLEVLQSIYNNQLQVLNNRMALAMTWLTILGTAVLVPNTLATIGGLLPLEGSSLTWFLYVILFSTLASTALAWWWVSKKIYLPTRADEFVPVNERRHRKR
ncbi:MAG: CorA-like Mg2+ transporter protein [Methanomassiliicoccales archaeon PtaU1.Bin030]|nr:MAG: CorA-like Mg2+ transporter protein [Methanomassiliicoccales archaeon PtaU1.Bin030]